MQLTVPLSRSAATPPDGIFGKNAGCRRQPVLAFRPFRARCCIKARNGAIPVHGPIAITTASADSLAGGIIVVFNINTRASPSSSTRWRGSWKLPCGAAFNIVAHDADGYDVLRCDFRLRGGDGVQTRGSAGATGRLMLRRRAAPEGAPYQQWAWSRRSAGAAALCRPLMAAATHCASGCP